MRCATAREAISALLDGEEPGAPDTDVAAHLDDCADCRRWADDVGALHRTLRIRPAEQVPDLSIEVMSRARPLVTDRRWTRITLAVVGALLALANLPALLAEPAHTGVGHMSRHIGIFDLALAVGFLYAARRPHAARGLFPMAAALGVFMAAGVAYDAVFGHALGVPPTHHLLELTGVALLVALQRPGRHRALPLTPTPA